MPLDCKLYTCFLVSLFMLGWTSRVGWSQYFSPPSQPELGSHPGSKTHKSTPFPTPSDWIPGRVLIPRVIHTEHPAIHQPPFRFLHPLLVPSVSCTGPETEVCQFHFELTPF